MIADLSHRHPRVHMHPHMCVSMQTTKPHNYTHVNHTSMRNGKGGEVATNQGWLVGECYGGIIEEQNGEMVGTLIRWSQEEVDMCLQIKFYWTAILTTHNILYFVAFMLQWQSWITEFQPHSPQKLKYSLCSF